MAPIQRPYKKSIQCCSECRRTLFHSLVKPVKSRKQLDKKYDCSVKQRLSNAIQSELFATNEVEPANTHHTQSPEQTASNTEQCSSADREFPGHQSQNPTSSAHYEPLENKQSSLPVRIALGMLQFYKLGISPMMPSSCRYLPTCSEYSMQSYKKFGVWKGTVLTAWRLMRCNPWGGKGFDPPSWPPKGLELVYRKNWELAPQATVVLGSVVFIYLIDGLLKEIGL
ncbi:hypothetical protein CEUSTIGMA_g6863.t1 [Chlamydomonas eustigma]|uniref:Membrane protein insertion efficiency factor n=1 Tax=Chlamydomonas eustigma TaxID=1157962 RepID=A0A250X954_9CHLO|nr:hypothetical protein CEUSTIGMA_g6863.t1 [Chlamydomonas eustigma]|eukprot:GAX79422.1 hypothetical protein CEUSTIGMA_g6863.t1 [Chlamydomonas eustigma]